MKKIMIILIIGFSITASAQRNQLYIKSDIYQHTQADVDAQYKGYCDIARMAWDYYYKGDYSTAIYYANRVSTAIIDQDYLYTQKTQILCLSYAGLGDKEKALKWYKKVQKKSPPDNVKSVEEILKSLGIIAGVVSQKSDTTTIAKPKKLYYTPDPYDETGMHNYRRDRQK